MCHWIEKMAAISVFSITLIHHGLAKSAQAAKTACQPGSGVV
jgi:hypothetical protein